MLSTSPASALWDVWTPGRRKWPAVHWVRSACGPAGPPRTRAAIAVPELPDVSVYIEALSERIVGRRLDRVLLRSPFVLRSVDPPIESVHGAAVRSIRRVGRRIVLAFDHELFLVIHLMIAGRLRWRDPGEKPGIGSKLLLAVFEFEHGSLLFTEAGSKKRASIQMVRGEEALRALDRGGIEPLEITRDEFREAL